MNTIEKLVASAIIVAGFLVAKDYFPNCMENKIYVMQITNGQVTETKFRSGNCYLMKE